MTWFLFSTLALADSIGISPSESTFSYTPSIFQRLDETIEPEITDAASQDTAPKEEQEADPEVVQSDFWYGFQTGWQAAKANTDMKRQIVIGGITRGTIYGTIDGTIIGGTQGILTPLAMTPHIILNNTYIYNGVQNRRFMPLMTDVNLERKSQEVIKGYQRGYKQYIRLYKRAVIASTGSIVTVSVANIVGILVHSDPYPTIQETTPLP